MTGIATTRPEQIPAAAFRQDEPGQAPGHHPLAGVRACSPDSPASVSATAACSCQPGWCAAVQALTGKLEHLPNVTMAVNAYASPNPALRSRDGRASLIVVAIRKDVDMMARTMAVDAMRATARGAVPGARVQVGGELGVMRDGMTSSQRDLMRGEIIALPVLLIALILIFGGLRAALLPVVGALVTSAGALTPLLGMTPPAC
jgi:RND superfamily putative drug exporter